MAKALLCLASACAASTSILFLLRDLLTSQSVQILAISGAGMLQLAWRQVTMWRRRACCWGRGWGGRVGAGDGSTGGLHRL